MNFIELLSYFYLIRQKKTQKYTFMSIYLFEKFDLPNITSLILEAFK